MVESPHIDKTGRGDIGAFGMVSEASKNLQTRLLQETGAAMLRTTRKGTRKIIKRSGPHSQK